MYTVHAYRFKCLADLQSEGRRIDPNLREAIDHSDQRRVQNFYELYIFYIFVFMFLNFTHKHLNYRIKSVPYFFNIMNEKLTSFMMHEWKKG